MGALSLYSMEKQEVHSSWMILTVLAEKSLASFNLQRRLRSSSYSIPHIYALIRLSNNLEEPPKSLVQSILSRILTFKGGLTPPKATPIKIPLLSHDDFRNATTKWLTSKVVPVKAFLIPFHLPPRHVVSAAHSSMGTFLTNHHEMMAGFSWDTPPPCRCSSFREQHPNIGGVNHPEDGRWHVASPLDAWHVSKRLRFLLGTSAKTQVYPALSSYIEETWAEVQRWARRHSVPNVNYEEWRNFVCDQWSQHAISSRTPLSFDDIKYIKSVLTGFVVQGRDHAPNHLHIFCPLLYWKILKNTFGDEEVYIRSLLTPNQAQDFLATMTKKPWLKPYRWGVQEAAKLPCSYLLLKQKKNFLKARPIISYKSFTFGRLFQDASSVLNMMLPVVFPNSYGHQSLPEIFQGLHQYLSNVDEDIELLEFNQDLVGFFTSLPTDQIMQTINHLIDSYAALQSTEFNKIKFTVQLGASEPKLRIFQGSYKCHKSKTGTIFLKDLSRICQLSLETSFFTQMGRIFKQTRGSAIGNQISPSLANIAVSYKEQQWYDSHRGALEALPSQVYIIRYVDNRLVLCSDTTSSRWFFQQFLAPYFYGHPVELEAVTDGEFLGTTLNPRTRSLEYRLPTARHQFRPFRTAGTDAHKYSAAYARICLASRIAFPFQQAEADVQTLVRSYTTYGYNVPLLKKAASSFLRQRTSP
eukprot:s2246_g8.t1